MKTILPVAVLASLSIATVCHADQSSTRATLSSLLENIAPSGAIDNDPNKAFPGATGWAQSTDIGTPAIWTVNTLGESTNGDGLISFREVASCLNEVSSCGSRIMAFSVGGMIDTGTNNVELRAGDGNLYIAGQTAPSPGIMLVGRRALDINNNADNIIIRHITSCPRDRLNGGINTNQRNITLGGQPSGAPDHVIVDHVSLNCSTDDTYTVFVGRATSDADRQVPSILTISNSIMGEGDTTCLRTEPGEPLSAPFGECGSGAAAAANGVPNTWNFGNHSMGAVTASGNGTPVTGVSFIANLFGNTQARNALMRGVVGEHVNNRVFNYGGFGIQVSNTGQTTNQNRMYITDNVFKFGPDTRITAAAISTTGGQFSITGNTQSDRFGVVTNDVSGNNQNTVAGHPRMHETGDNDFIASCVGASKPVRNVADQRMVDEFNEGGLVLPTAEIGIGPRVPWNFRCQTELGLGNDGYPRNFCFYENDPTDEANGINGYDDQGQRKERYAAYPSASHSANYDTDGDGMADAFEQQLVNADPNDGLNNINDINPTDDLDSDGYTVAEEWVNLLARCPGVDADIDTDGDGVNDATDNCTLIANADQRDTNGDGYGNICDADLDNNLTVNAADLGLLRTMFFDSGAGIDADFNGDNIVNVVDLGIMRQLFFAPPGPSGTAP